MTVAEIFQKADLSVLGPVRWGKQVPESRSGVYLVARVADPNVNCKTCALPFKPIGSDLKLDHGYEKHRWLKSEPVVYIGKTDQTIRKRVGAFYLQKCGNRGPHAGGQVVKLLKCDLWVHWSPSTHPKDDERKMLCAFKKHALQVPFGNFDGMRRRKRILKLKR